MGRDRAGRPVRCPSSLALRQGFWQSMQRHAHPAGMTRDPYFAAQGGSGSADAATTRCRGVRKQHQIPGGGSCPTISITTSSLLAPAQAEAHSPIDSRRPGSASCSSSAVTISPRAGQLGLDRGIRQWQVPRSGILAGQPWRGVPTRGQLLRRREHEILRSCPVPTPTAGLRRNPAFRWQVSGLAHRLPGPRAVLHPS